ncbi:endonuclease/exonuclease/phosphatase family protein [Conservatibacter flavescens]|uniref:Endonuclease n=1 Tax=Conservatibacter flavescens TaxID=28161 RepID=A0A2M8S2C7_9PAST|nr:endonuclease/exonuclease/phosphatase family protein [Conservatibacter flavescens]PJG85277.1 endonuclease [Conservatibacter flavescens]
MNTFLDYLLTAFLLLPVIATLLPLIKHDHWIFRVGDFPRLQIAVLSLISLLVNAGVTHFGSPVFMVIGGMNVLCLLYQLKEVSAYTRLSQPEVRQYDGEENERTISLLTSNVLTPNRRSDLLLAQIQQQQPDIVLTLESDLWWEQQLSVLEQQNYIYTVKIPLDNLYGMHLYSRLPLRNVEIRHWVTEDIPSIAAEVQLRSNEWIRIYCLHPMPPSPTESDTATDRDAELLLVGKEIQRLDQPVLVFGDLNDVAWSSTSRLFQQISGLLDPRKGRGLFSTFHAHYPLLRWPLDHIFHSNDFMITQIKVLPNIGSDHFPVYGKFQFMPAIAMVQEEPEATKQDNEEARAKINKADPIKHVVKEKYSQ